MYTGWVYATLQWDGDGAAFSLVQAGEGSKLARCSCQIDGEMG